MKHAANRLVHPIMQESITRYEKLANDPITKEVWQKAMCQEYGSLAQGFETATGTNTVFFTTKDEIITIPRDRTVTLHA